jgi:hypothetical protein
VDGTLASLEYVYADGTDAALLDIVEVDVTAARPEPHQPENWVLAPRKWKLVQQLPRAVAMQYLSAALVAGPVLLENRSDRVDHAALLKQPAKASLALVEPQSIEWHITTSPFDEKRKTRCRFVLAGCQYDLSITDPRFVPQLDGLPDGIYPKNVAASGLQPHDRVVLCVSLGEPFVKTGHCYKLVAGVLVLPAITAGSSSGPARKKK